MPLPKPVERRREDPNEGLPPSLPGQCGFFPAEAKVGYPHHQLDHGRTQRLRADVGFPQLNARLGQQGRRGA